MRTGYDLSKAVGVDVGGRWRANVAHVRQSRSDSGLGLEGKVLQPFKGVALRSEAGQGEAPGADALDARI